MSEKRQQAATAFVRALRILVAELEPRLRGTPTGARTCSRARVAIDTIPSRVVDIAGAHIFSYRALVYDAAISDGAFFAAVRASAAASARNDQIAIIFLVADAVDGAPDDARSKYRASLVTLLDHYIEYAG